VTTATKKRRAKTRRKPRPRTDTSLTQTGPGDKLTVEQQTAVVQRLAMFDTPTQVVEFVKEEFGVELTRQSVQHYDPTVGEKPSERWCKIFEATRKAFLESQADIPIAQRSFRLRRLQRMAEAAEKRGAWVVAAQLCEQAAKEVGDVYTNRSKVAITDPNGEPFRVIVEEDTRGPTGGQG
jgi:hypothetical protein